MTERPHWSDIYLDFAQMVSKRSTCRRLNVGCVVVSGDFQRVLAIGYNGNWALGPNECDSDVPGQCGCLHAEVNALIKFNHLQSNGDAIMFCTHAPCKMCAKLIVNSGIKTVRYRQTYRSTDGIELLNLANVKVELWEKDR